MAIVIVDVRNCKYVAEDNSLINCEAKFTGLPLSNLDNTWLPFTANPEDPAEHGKTLFANAVNGDYGVVAGFEAPNFDQEIFNLRMERSVKLAETDWTQNADVPQATKDKWAAYRQELRDLTEGMDTAEKARAVVFPTPPE